MVTAELKQASFGDKSRRRGAFLTDITPQTHGVLATENVGCWFG